MQPEQIEPHFQQLQEEQQLILNQIDNAIALFDSSHKLVLHNHKLAQLLGLSAEWLDKQPYFQELFAQVVAQGYLSQAQYEQIQAILPLTVTQNTTFFLEQPNGTHLETKVSILSNGRCLFTFSDVTAKEQARREATLIQANLNAEIKRLRFLQGLSEQLQPARELKEIGEFALSYLVQATGAAFGDVKVITGNGKDAYASILTNNVSAEFIATYGIPAVKEIEATLNQGIPYRQGLLWQVVETGLPMFVDDYKNHPLAVPAFRHPGIGQLGLFPIASPSRKVIGILTLESRSMQKLQEAPQQDMLLAACRTLGVAIERAQAQEHLRQANEDLERASQLKSEFLASMSHELRTPLNSILGFADLLQRQLSGTLTPRQFNHVQAIEKSGQHLLQLINDLLDLSKIEVGKAELYLAPVSIQKLCSECLKMIQPRADKKRIVVTLEIDYRLEEVFLDERRVRQIVINLLSNAVKFTPDEGLVQLGGRLTYGFELQHQFRPDRSPVNASTPYLCLEVKDNGIGIPEDKLHLLFRPFQQLDSSLARHHEGTGLGLALTKRLAELHGGTVSVESQENKGSIFRVWLPLTEMLTSRSESTTKSKFQPQSATIFSNELAVEDGKRILIVEDQPLNQALICEVLELQGYAVEVIHDGQTMQETIYSPLATSRSIPQLILMDIQLPGVDGFELIRQLKAHPIWQNVPVIAVTAMAMPGDRDRCIESGADGYLSKPLDLEKLITTMQAFLACEAKAPDSLI
ncbi:MAG TPA: ATP-binding protein [Coleofasciculaceae cyanobacterium]